MKLNSALFILRKIMDREVQRMVSEVDERAIYREMARRWFAWTGKRWIAVKRF
jgi:hypothetical protein